MDKALIIKDRVYGEWHVSDPLALSLIQLPQFQRLYKVGQYGSYWFGIPEADVNRAEHSLGVYNLTRYFGASREEQIAALLHDISHTTFSHVIDYLHGDPTTQEHQDNSHLSVMRQNAISSLLEGDGFDYVKLADLELYHLLERELPDLCCDRLDYFLRDSICYNEISSIEAQGILSHITIFDSTLVVDDPDVGRFISKHSLEMTKKYWAPPFGNFMFERLAEALRRAIENKVISDDDFYTTDFEVWDKLKASGDEYILRRISDIENIKTLKMCLDTENYDYYLQGKFRPIDPPVLFNNVLRRATDIFPELAKTIAFERERFNKGFYLRVVRG